jgi:hypothetical protein
MCHNIHPLVDMNMKTIRQCIIQQLGYLESDTFSISQKDCHMYCTIQCLHMPCAFELS